MADDELSDEVEETETANPEAAVPRGRSRIRWILPAAVAILVILAVGGFLLLRDSSPKHHLTGTFTLSTASIIAAKDKSCVGKGGYDDIDSRTQVTVTDGDGKLLATGSLGSGQLKPGTTTVCIFPIVVDDSLPKKGFYKIEVGRRGALSYSYSDMQQRDWAVAFTLG